MIAAAIVAVVTAVFINRIRTQQRAVAQIVELGGRVVYQDTLLGGLLPESVRKSVGDHVAANVVSVELLYRTLDRKMTTPTKDGLVRFVDAVKRLPHVKSLKTHTLNLKDDDLAFFAPLKSQIEELTINEYFHGDFHGSQLDRLVGWNQLKTLSIFSSRRSVVVIEPDTSVQSSQPGQLNLKPLAKLPRLESFTFGNGTLSEEVFADLSQLSHLKILTLNSCRFDGNSFALLGKLENLETIWLNNIQPEADFGPYSIRDDGTKKYLEEPTFRYEQYHGEWGQAKDFPQDKYDEWIKQTIGDVKLIWMLCT